MSQNRKKQSKSLDEVPVDAGMWLAETDVSRILHCS
jgi:hypothetical protein